MKESGLRIRVDENLRKSFLNACKKQDTTASQAIRAFMRSYVDETESELQGKLFEVAI